MAVVTWTCCSVPFTAADGRLTITLCGLLLGSSLLRPWGGGLNRKSVTDILWRILLSDDGLRHAARLKRTEVDFCSGGKWSFSLGLISGGLLRSVFAVTPETAQQVLFMRSFRCSDAWSCDFQQDFSSAADQPLWPSERGKDFCCISSVWGNKHLDAPWGKLSRIDQEWSRNTLFSRAFKCALSFSAEQ